MPSEGRRRAHLEHVIRSEETAHDTTYGFTASVVPATGPQGSRANLALLQTAPPPSRLYAAAISRPQRKVVPSTHMRWRTTATCAPAPPSLASCRAAWPPPGPNA